jgi:hypothetical protein
MNRPASARHVVHPAFAVSLIIFSWLAVPTPATAVGPAAPAAVIAVTAAPFADSDGWGVRKLLGSTHNRTRVIQIAVVCMCFGLFILMRR